MAVGGVLATQLNSAAVWPKSLTVGGVDMIKRPGMAGNDYGVSPDSVTVTENGPGGVSAMSFTIDDPQLMLAVADGMEVRYWDNTLGFPIFTGWVDSWGIRPDFGSIGRTYEVQCVGPEALLDWAAMPSDITFPAAMSLLDAIQSAATNAYVTGPLRALSGPPVNSSQAAPISGNTAAIPLLNAVTVTAGTTLREAIRQLSAQTVGAAGYGYSQAATWVATVDFWYGLRVYPDDPIGSVTSDYFSFVVSDTNVAPPPWHAADLSYDTESSTVRAVIVKGTGVTAIVPDGSGKQGPTAVLNDSTITTAAAALAAGIAYLTQYAVNIRGTFVMESYPPSTDNSSSSQIRPGSTVTITDTPTGLSTGRKVYTITKRFENSGKEEWTIAFGGLPPSSARLVRRLTRGTLS